MGNKTHPLSFRLNRTKNWDSIWFNKVNYSYFLQQDILIKKFIKEFFYLRNISVSNILILRQNYNNIQIFLNLISLFGYLNNKISFSNLKKKRFKFKSKFKSKFKFFKKKNFNYFNIKKLFRLHNKKTKFKFYNKQKKIIQKKYKFNIKINSKYNQLLYYIPKNKINKIKNKKIKIYKINYIYFNFFIFNFISLFYIKNNFKFNLSNKFFIYKLIFLVGKNKINWIKNRIYKLTLINLNTKKWNTLLNKYKYNFKQYIFKNKKFNYNKLYYFFYFLINIFNTNKKILSYKLLFINICKFFFINKKKNNFLKFSKKNYWKKDKKYNYGNYKIFNKNFIYNLNIYTKYFNIQKKKIIIYILLWNISQLKNKKKFNYYLQSKKINYLNLKEIYYKFKRINNSFKFIQNIIKFKFKPKFINILKNKKKFLNRFSTKNKLLLKKRLKNNKKKFIRKYFNINNNKYLLLKNIFLKKKRFIIKKKKFKKKKNIIDLNTKKKYFFNNFLILFSNNIKNIFFPQKKIFNFTYNFKNIQNNYNLFLNQKYYYFLIIRYNLYYLNKTINKISNIEISNIKWEIIIGNKFNLNSTNINNYLKKSLKKKKNQNKLFNPLTLIKNQLGDDLIFINKIENLKKEILTNNLINISNLITNKIKYLNQFIWKLKNNYILINYNKYFLTFINNNINYLKIAKINLTFSRKNLFLLQNTNNFFDNINYIYKKNYLDFNKSNILKNKSILKNNFKKIYYNLINFLKIKNNLKYNYNTNFNNSNQLKFYNKQFIYLIQGFFIKGLGRLGKSSKSTRSKNTIYKIGKTKKNSFNTLIDYNFTTQITRNGLYGLKTFRFYKIFNIKQFIINNYKNYLN